MKMKMTFIAPPTPRDMGVSGATRHLQHDDSRLPQVPAIMLTAKPPASCILSRTLRKPCLASSPILGQEPCGSETAAIRNPSLYKGATVYVLSPRAAMKRSRNFVEKIKAIDNEDWEAVLLELSKAEEELIKESGSATTEDTYRSGVNVHMYTACISHLTKSGKYREALDIFLHRMPSTEVIHHSTSTFTSRSQRSVLQSRSRPVDEWSSLGPESFV